MPYSTIPYKSYCWSLGTTSFRMKQFNFKIEEQLSLLSDFFNISENKDEIWQANAELQIRYYNYLKSKNFVTGNESRPAKFAREKTSGLCDFGLIDDNRRLTNVGKNLLQISKDCNFTKHNILKIPNDSYIFCKQMLKAHVDVNGNIVRPYIVLVYLLSKLEYLTKDEFTYLLPLCTTKENTQQILDKIILLRNNETNIEKIITNMVLKLPNYPQAKELFLANNVTEELICTIGMNRKSRNYDRPYFPFYNELKKVCVDKDVLKLTNVYNLTGSLKLKTLWRKYLFSKTSRITLNNNPEICKTEADIFKVRDEQQFKELFFNQLHLFKVKATLSDYSDLNERYFKTTDTVIFTDNKVSFDIIPKYFFKNIANTLFEEAFSTCELLYENCKISEISSCLNIDEKSVYSEIQEDLGIIISSEHDLQNIIADERLKRFNTLIEEKFSNEKLIELLTYFEERNDSKIFEFVTENATIPTIFEYILGIIWYKISEFKGNILEYMNLSLEADLLPKSHACGGEADIVYKYEETEHYPQHDVLIEATLMDESTQRRGEMEPVSRHLGTHILKTANKAYCTFISPYLDINVLSHFRSLKNIGYYNPQDYSKHVPSLKVIPLKTKELKTILQKGIKYNVLYSIMDKAFEKESPIPTWYENELVANL